MRTITDSAYNQSSGSHNQPYSASVPVSVYRELSAELQMAQAAIHQLNQQNEHLAQENHVLRQEIAKTVNAVLHLQNAVNSPNYSTEVASTNKPNHSFNQTSARTKKKQYAPTKRHYRSQEAPQEQVRRSRTSAVAHNVTEFFEPLPEPVFIEEEQVSYYYDDESELSQVSGWWLILAIVFIIVMGFGAGYVVVRPLLENHTSSQ
ncbi:hypothetical protein Riv7116_3877 [Rivularia sp. PCC 7116]|uniref:hypothetical protein n=1 Tax=Rivularia sp. PCC 7116 TaxID=373994 RepID=UPI00029F0FB4|nr:hypothetical protein [Rivularia sp. PCC 7116]AFY56319.1 hypothetical protein Riv7116_3877 [Rivularia sp. PCC 7116]